MSGHWIAELCTQKRGSADEENVRENSRHHRRQWPEERTLPGLLENEEGGCGLWKRVPLRRRGKGRTLQMGRCLAAHCAPLRVRLKSESDGGLDRDKEYGWWECDLKEMRWQASVERNQAETNDKSPRISAWVTGRAEWLPRCGGETGRGHEQGVINGGHGKLSMCM